MAYKKEIDIAEVERLAGLGLSEEQIALSVGVCRDTITRRKREDPAFHAAIKRGKAKTATDIANALYNKAMTGDTTAIIWYEKTRCGFSDKQRVEHAGPDGNAIVMKFEEALLKAYGEDSD